MLLSNLPIKFPIPFANNAGAGYTRAIPQASQTGITPGAASLFDGFPPICFIPTTANGIPPAGQDINGILNAITAWNRWQAAGGNVPFDPTFATEIGGYPSGAIVQSTTPGRLWLNTADNNTTNPDGGSPQNWIGLALLSDVTSTINTYQIVGGRAVTFATPGSFSWPVPTGVTIIEAEIWGAGGSGAGGIQGYGGGPGGYARGAFAVTPGQSLPIIVGPGGAPSVGDSGNYGGATSVGSFITANGGGPGINSQGLGGVPGSSSGGSVNVTASRGGGAPYPLGNNNYGQGAGGASPFGGAAGQVGINANGADGVFPGAGSGGSSLAGGVSGRGASGFVILRY